jgi:hypothetical protein
MHAMLILWRKARNLRKLLAIDLEASISRLMWLRLCVSILYGDLEKYDGCWINFFMFANCML